MDSQMQISCPGFPLALGKCINPQICFMPEQEKVEASTEDYHDYSHTHTHFYQNCREKLHNNILKVTNLWGRALGKTKTNTN
jgi:hypothetical protein